MTIGLALSLLFSSLAFGQAIQHKACQRNILVPFATGYLLPCQFDKPVKQGDMLVQIVLGANNIGGHASPDTLENVWQEAGVVPYYNGSALFYALDAKGGIDAVEFPVNGPWEGFIAEYPPSTGLDGFAFNTYFGNNLDQPPGSGNDVGWTYPIETSQSGELLIGWEMNGTMINSLFFPTPGPGFTIRDYEYGNFMFEDAWTGAPGLYIASVEWNVYGHWTMGMAAFKMK